MVREGDSDAPLQCGKEARTEAGDYECFSMSALMALRQRLSLSVSHLNSWFVQKDGSSKKQTEAPTR